MSGLPPGFVIDGQSQGVTSQGAVLPSGFVIDKPPNAKAVDPATLNSQFWQAQAKGDQAGMQAAFNQMRAQGVNLTSPQAGSIATDGTGSTSQNIAAGAGKSLYDTARGLGQLTGLQSQGDIDAAHQLDAALMNTTAGKIGVGLGTAGQFSIPIGDVAGALGIAGRAAPFVNAGIKGLAFGAAQPVQQGESRLGNAEINSAVAVGGQGIASGLGALAKRAAPVLDTVKQGGIDYLRSLGMQLHLSQVTDSPFLQKLVTATNQLPFSGAFGKAAQQSADFTQAASNLVGENTPKLGQDVMNAVKQKLGNAYDTLFGRNNVVMDMPTAQRLGAIADQADTDLTPDEAQVVKNQIAKYTDAATQNGGSIPGKLYQSIRGQLQNLQSPDAKGALIGDVRKVMQDAAKNSFTGDDAAALNLTNQQYSNMKILEKSLAGGHGSLDEVAPGSLWSKVNGAYGATPEMRALAQAGKNVLAPIPQGSPTATRELFYRMLGLGGAGSYMGGLEGAFGAMAAPAVVGITLGRFLNSPLAARLLPGATSNTLNGLARLIGNDGAANSAYAMEK